MKARKKVLFYLNGKRHEVGPEHAGMMLADYLRYERALTGTKIVCAEGDCGACSVLRLFPVGETKNRYVSINSCITTVAQMDCSRLVTVDALGRNLVQQAMISCHGSQCGFCTPGFVVAMTDLVEKKLCRKDTDQIDAQEAKNSMTGNLCRCTGYQPIIDAAMSIDLSKYESVKNRFYSPAQERDLKKIFSTPIFMKDEKFSFYAPRTLKDATKYLTKNRDARLIGAATDLGVVHNKLKIRLEKLVSLHLIPSLFEIKKTGAKVTVGARATLTELRESVKTGAPEFARFLDLFASPQIKNVATLIGNVGNASPIADTPPFLLVSGAEVKIAGVRGIRSVPLDRFYLGYRKTALKPGELISSISFNLPKKTESLALYKVSQRKDLDISGVNAAFHVVWKSKTQIAAIRIAMGGVGPTPLRLKKTETALKGAEITAGNLSHAVETLHSEMKPLSDLRGSSAFRRVLVENLFYRFFREHASFHRPHQFLEALPEGPGL